MNTEDQLASISIFSELSKKERKAVSNLMTTVDVPSGQVLTKQGELGREFLIILKGTAKVEIDGSVVAHISDGDFVGELSLITGVPRSATVTATSDLSIELLNRREFMAMLDNSPGAAKKILIAAVKRLQQNQSTQTD